MIIILFILLISLSIFSFGFVDPNLELSTSLAFSMFHEPVRQLVFEQRPIASIVFMVILFGLYWVYIRSLIHGLWKMSMVLLGVCAILVFSYPALTHDLFNYITTAKMTYFYGENPYVVMPIEIPNEPYLAFTRAANKYALYGPVWILISFVPHFLGMDSIWQTIIAFKCINAIAYALFSYFIYKTTQSYKNVIFFALNPLVLIEALVSGHNDIFMMLLALVGFWLWTANPMRSKILGFLLIFLSWFTKGATVILSPLFFVKRIPWEKTLLIAYCLMSFVFIVVAPLREELYPWYAVWIIMIASLLPLSKYAFIYWFTIVLSFSLELRHLPYMWMGYYEGPGPMLRLLLTVVPISLFLVFYFFKRLFHREAI